MDTQTFLMNEINKTTVWRNLEAMRTGTWLLAGEERPHMSQLSHTHLSSIPVEKRLEALGWEWGQPWRRLWRYWWRWEPHWPPFSSNTPPYDPNGDRKSGKWKQQLLNVWSACSRGQMCTVISEIMNNYHNPTVTDSDCSGFRRLEVLRSFSWAYFSLKCGKKE